MAMAIARRSIFAKCNTIAPVSPRKNAVVSEVMSDMRRSPARGWKFWLSLALVLLLIAYVAMVVAPRLRIETNLLALLPSTSQNQLQLGAVRRFAERSS